MLELWSDITLSPGIAPSPTPQIDTKLEDMCWDPPPRPLQEEDGDNMWVIRVLGADSLPPKGGFPPQCYDWTLLFVVGVSYVCGGRNFIKNADFDILVTKNRPVSSARTFSGTELTKIGWAKNSFFIRNLMPVVYWNSCSILLHRRWGISCDI